MRTAPSARLRPVRLGGILLVLAVVGAAPPVPDPELPAALATLRAAEVATDGPALLAFFRARTLAEGDRAKLATLVHNLGDDSFAVRESATRELIRRGEVARPFLQAARNEPDLEVVRRAERCLRALEDGSEQAATVAAARVLAVRRPRAAEVLLAYLPNREDAITEAVLDALLAVGAPGGKPDPALVKALADKDPFRRAAAAHVLGREAAGQRRAVRGLLDDRDAGVRFRAAAALARVGEAAAVPALIALLAQGPAGLARQAEDLLYQVAGEAAPTATLGGGTEKERRECRTAWDGWWKANAARANLSRLRREPPFRNLSIVCDCDVGGRSTFGRLWVCGRDGKALWQIDGVRNPADVQVLPGDRYLIAECQGYLVTERDRKGTVLWQHRVKSHPVSCQRLPNGNTFIATYTELLEVTRAGTVVYSHPSPQSTFWAEKLRNGNILAINSRGQIVETSTAGKEVRSINLAAEFGWAGVERLPGGRLLVALYSQNKVVEIDASGKVINTWAVQTPAWATRLRNGNTLVASPEGRKVVEFSPTGKEVWSQTTAGRPFRVRRY